MSSETPKVPEPRLDNIISLDALRAANGEPGHQLWLACWVESYQKFCVFDVSSRADLYGPGNGYNVLTARDASYALATMDLKTDKTGIQGLTDEQRETLNGWAKKFLEKYPVVGILDQSP